MKQKKQKKRKMRKRNFKDDFYAELLSYEDHMKHAETAEAIDTLLKIIAIIYDHLRKKKKKCRHLSTWFDRTICPRKDGTEGMATICNDCGKEI